MSPEDLFLAAVAVVFGLSAFAFVRLVRSAARRNKRTSASGLPTPPTAVGQERIGPLAANALLLVALGAALLFAGEVYFRFFFDSTDSFAITKVTQAWIARHSEPNAQGYRDSVDYARRRPTASDGDASSVPRRITFLGDSFLAGFGVPDVENRFANRIRAKRPEWEVQVRARLGLNSGGELALLREQIEQGVEFDVLVLVYCLNDIQAVAPESQAHDERIRRYQTETRPAIVRASFFLDRLYFQWLAARDPALRGYFETLRTSYTGPAWAAHAELLRELIATARDADLDFRVVTFPFLQSLGHDYAFREAHQVLDEFWRREGVPHLDLLPLYQAHAAGTLVVNDRDAHPNERAHALATEPIEAFLLRPARPISGPPCGPDLGC